MQCYPFIHSLDQTAEPAPNLKLVCAHDCKAQPVEWLWSDKIPIGKVTLLIGDPGTGKSLVALDIAARLSRGSAWPDAEHGAGSEEHGAKNGRQETENQNSGSKLRAPCSTLILSATDDLADTIRPRLDAAGADPRHVFLIPSIADLRDDFAQLRAAVNCAPNCRLIIIDPINAYVGPSDSHFQSVMRKVLAPLAQLAAEKRIAVLAIAHLRKNDGPAIHRAAGSMGFVAAARAVWTVCRDQDNPARHLFLPLKNNLSSTACGLAYSIQSNTLNEAPTIVWDSSPITTPTEETLRGRQATDLNAARQWLRKALMHGPRSASQVTDEAAHYGFHSRTLRRALHAIGGNTQNRGLLEGWWWSLPDDATFNHQSAPGSAGGLYEREVALPISNDADPFANTVGTPTDNNPTFAPSPAPSPQPPAPETPVPLCPLPEIFNEPPAVHPSPEPQNISDRIAFSTPRDCQDRRTGRFSDQFSQPSPHRHQKPKQKPKQRPTKTGNPILDQLLDALRQPPAHPQNIPQPTAHDSS